MNNPNPAYAKAYPDVRENLLHVYGLKPIMDKVARFDPQGRKNKLRKSYKGFVTNLPGRIDVVAKPTPLGGQFGLDPEEDKDKRLLTYLAFWPEDDWKASQVAGKEITRGLDLGKIQRAVAGMGKGDIPGVCSAPPAEVVNTE